jgi:hypothetical protein
MKRLLLSACIVGLVFAGHSNSPQGQFVSDPLDVAAPPVSGGVSSRAKSLYPGLQQVALRSPAVGALQADGTPVASIDDLFAPALPQAAKPTEDAKASDVRLVDESAMWVVVIRGAWIHSGPSVSTPVVGHQSPGKEMHLIDSSQGWYQVLDPETGKRGWVYAKYYVEPIDRPGQKRVAAVQEPQLPVNAAPAAAAPPKAVRKVLQQPRFLAPPQAQAERVRQRARPLEGVAGLLDRAFRR